MSNAKSILSERLAKGEINESEYDRLVAKLDESPTAGRGNSASAAIPTSAPSQSTNENPDRWKSLGTRALLVAAGVGAFYLYGQFSNAGGGKFDIGNLRSSGAGGVVSFNIRNTHSRSDDVVIYITQDGRRMCEKIAKMDAESSYEMSFYCPSMGLGTFNVNAAWASYRPEIASVAERIQ